MVFMGMYHWQNDGMVSMDRSGHTGQCKINCSGIECLKCILTEIVDCSDRSSLRAVTLSDFHSSQSRLNSINVIDVT